MIESRLRALIQREGWTQVEAAEKLGVTQAWVSRTLSGRSRNLDSTARVIERLTELERHPSAVAVAS